MGKRYSFIDHPADTGLEIYADSGEELFEAAAEGMFSLLIDLKQVKTESFYDIHVKADNYENLLIYWLQELLYYFSVDLMLFSEFSVSIHQNSGGRLILNGRCRGEAVDLLTHEIYTEIKSATYHQLTVTQTPKEWYGRVIFDL